MKYSRFTRHSLLLAATAGTMLSSCHSTLYRAAERGDIATVRREIAYANTLSVSDKREYLRGDPPDSNLWWIIPTALITIPIDLTLMFGTLFIYPSLTCPNSSLSDVVWSDFYSGRYNSAIQRSFRNNHDDITFELMQAGASTPEYISNWMYKNYPAYQPVITVQEPSIKQDPKGTPTSHTPVPPNPGTIEFGTSVSQPGS